jgi:hypothetical protein
VKVVAVLPERTASSTRVSDVLGDTMTMTLPKRGLVLLVIAAVAVDYMYGTRLMSIIIVAAAVYVLVVRWKMFG